MGNIRSHAEISAHVIGQLARLRPDEEYLYLELGNFLTDVSQFRDPYSCFHAKKTVRMQAIVKKLPIPILGLPLGAATLASWLNELLGSYPDRRFGTFAEFFTQLSRFAAHLFFAEDSRYNLARVTTLINYFANLPVKPLSAAEVDRVFANAFTQYYPHEHLDFPPYHDPEREGPDYRKSNLYQRQSSGLIGYLEEQIQYISEELSRIELDWVRSNSQPASHQSRRNVMARLGHILHAAEDFFFHSNFAEIYQWQRLLYRYPGRQVQNAADFDWLRQHDLEGTTETTGDVMLRRRLARRLRYPIYVSKGFGAAAPYTYEPSPSDSEDATNIVYTGGFGRNDIFHTIHGALLGMEEVFAPIYRVLVAREQMLSPSKQGQQITGSDLVLLRVMFSEEERKKMVADKSGKYEDSLVKQHKEQLNKGEYDTTIQKLKDQGHITAAGADALHQAFEIDRKFENAHRDPLPGVGGFLIKFFSSMQEEIDKSSQRVLSLNGKEQSILDQSTDNAASAEMVGTHSLMAKDDDKKQPLRYAAVALAKHASASLAVLMAERVNQNASPLYGLDWDSIIRFYVRFPAFRRQGWEAEIMASVEQNQGLPNVRDVKDQPNFRLLGPDFGSDKLQARRDGKGRGTLEDRYKGLEAKA